MLSCNVYNKTTEGGVKIADHFKVSEMACKDGSGIVLVHPWLPPVLEKIREKLGGAPIIINSGFRTWAHNKSVGGAPSSYHLYGIAADIQVPGYLPITVARAASSVLGDSGGVGLYSSFVHVDCRVNRYRFDKRSGAEKAVSDF